MSSSKPAKGKCLCGAVEISVEKIASEVGVCHCSMCRKWGGGPYVAVDCGTEVSIKGEEHVTAFNSSDWAERMFCSDCGTHLFYRLKATGQHIATVGLFEDDSSFVLNHQIFIDEKPAYYEFANKTENMTGAEFLEQWSSSTD